MGVQKELFGTDKEGKEVYLYTLSNSRGMKAKVMNYGAILVDLIVPDKEGKTADVVLGYDKLSEYFVNGCFFGAVIGPNANRIANARFILDGVEYHLDPNDGMNNLHSHKELGVHKRIWEAQEIENGVVFSVDMPKLFRQWRLIHITILRHWIIRKGWIGKHNIISFFKAIRQKVFFSRININICKDKKDLSGNLQAVIAFKTV